MLVVIAVLQNYNSYIQKFFYWIYSQTITKWHSEKMSMLWWLHHRTVLGD